MTRKNEYLELLKPFLGNKMEVTEHSYIIKNDVCGEIFVNYWDTKGFNFYCPNIEKLPFIDFDAKNTISKNFPKQNNIFKPTQKKIDFEIERIEKIYLQCLEQSKQKVKDVQQFYSKIETLGGKHIKHDNTGYIDFKHYELQYTIHNSGYIEQRIRLKYQGQAIDFLLTQK